jgi:hypothetical protein
LVAGTAVLVTVGVFVAVLVAIGVFVRVGVLVGEFVAVAVLVGGTGVLVRVGVLVAGTAVLVDVAVAAPGQSASWPAPKRTFTGVVLTLLFCETAMPPTSVAVNVSRTGSVPGRSTSCAWMHPLPVALKMKTARNPELVVENAGSAGETLVGQCQLGLAANVAQVLHGVSVGVDQEC